MNQVHGEDAPVLNASHSGHLLDLSPPHGLQYETSHPISSNIFMAKRGDDLAPSLRYMMFSRSMLNSRFASATPFPLLKEKGLEQFGHRIQRDDALEELAQEPRGVAEVGAHLRPLRPSECL